MGCSIQETLVLCVPAPPAICNESEFDRTLKCRWRKAVEAGLTRYRLDWLQNKVIPGKYGFVVQYNPAKSKPGWRRPCQLFLNVNPTFDPSLFNFNSIKPEEVLMKCEELNDCYEDNLLVINLTPLEFGSCLLVPRVSESRPQVMTLHGLELLIRTVLRSADPHLKAGFSSAGGCASVNHHHYHIYYLDKQLYLETAPVKHIRGPCFAVTDFPSKGFAFQLDTDPNLLARHVFTLADFMRQNEMAHNMFITRGRRFERSSPGASVDTYDTLRVFLWAREPAFGAKKESGMSPALCELAGHLLLTDLDEYDAMTERAAVQILQGITATWFQRVLVQIPHLFRNDLPLTRP